jgi:peptidyl-dipeptidase A
MVYSPEWMRQDLGLPVGKVEELRESAQENSRLFALIFSRWTQVMYRFEKGLYEDPDQDLNKLWWDLVEKYQFVQRPEGRNAPDWATKIHIISTPVYYQNYTLGYLYASQLRHHINADILETDEKYLSYSGKKEVGAYLAKEVFSPGTRYGWKELIRRSTGEELNLGYFAREVAK